ncbi:MAG: hypothetical protein M5U28_56555 [Sandaracinaceae bacterium]|nr:hypothetical protein [Sandaracinaceae bacterium]
MAVRARSGAPRRTCRHGRRKCLPPRAQLRAPTGCAPSNDRHPRGRRGRRVDRDQPWRPLVGTRSPLGATCSPATTSTGSTTATPRSCAGPSRRSSRCSRPGSIPWCAGSSASRPGPASTSGTTTAASAAPTPSSSARRSTARTASTPYPTGSATRWRSPGRSCTRCSCRSARCGPATRTPRASSRKARRCSVYPGGDLDSMRPFRDRDRVVFGPRRGYVRLALRAGVPIVPVVAAGAHATSLVLTDGRALARALGLQRALRLEVCPVTVSVPWGLVVGITPPYVPMPTRILVEVMEPIAFDRCGEEAAADRDYVERCHERVHGAMEATLERLAAERRASRRAGTTRLADRAARALREVLEAPR